MVFTVTEVLNYFNIMGVFSYVLPFLLIFAVVYAILKKTQILGSDGNNNAIYTIVAAAIGLLALQYDMVPLFFANIFPKFGVLLSLILAALILFGLGGVSSNENIVKVLGIGGGVFVILWALNDFLWYGGFSGGFFVWSEYVWSLLVLGAVVGAIVWVSKS